MADARTPHTRTPHTRPQRTRPQRTGTADAPTVVLRPVAPAELATPPGVAVVSAAAVCLLAYSYLVGLWPSAHGAALDLVVVVRMWVNQPTGIGEDFGFLGTALLLLAAGFAVDASGWPPLVRLLRGALPPALCAIAVAALLAVVGLEPLVDPAVTTPVAAVALFGLLVGALLPLLRRMPALGVLVLLEVACVLALLGGWAAGAGDLPALAPLGPVAGLVPLVALGQVVRLAHTGRLGRARALLLGLVCLVLLVLTDELFPADAGFWHPLGALYALLLFLIALPRGASVASARPVRWLADRALPLFAAVPVVGYPVLGLLPALPFGLALPVALAATGLVGELLHRCRGVLA